MNSRSEVIGWAAGAMHSRAAIRTLVKDIVAPNGLVGVCLCFGVAYCCCVQEYGDKVLWRMPVTAFQNSVVWFGTYRNMTLFVFMSAGFDSLYGERLFLLCTASRPPLGLSIPISAVIAVLLPVIRPLVVTCVRAVLCVLACCVCIHNGSSTLPLQ